MKSNYNDIIDIILTILEDKEVESSILVEGSITPYLITKKESKIYHGDFNILVKHKKMDYVRKYIAKLCKEYELNIIEDSKKYIKEDYGFRVKYYDTTITFKPYTFLSNNFVIKSYFLNDDQSEIVVKEKKVSDITKNSIIRYTNFSKDKKIRLLSPEYTLANIELKEKDNSESKIEVIKLLNKLCDDSILVFIRKKLVNKEIKMEKYPVDKNNNKLIIILSALIIFLIILVCICFIK